MSSDELCSALNVMRRTVEYMVSIAAARERIMADQVLAIGIAHAALVAAQEWFTVGAEDGPLTDRDRDIADQVEAAIALIEGRPS